MLALEPSTQDLSSLLKSPLILGKATNNTVQSIQERLRISQQNEQSAWMYAGAEQFIRNKDSASARTQLQMLWNDAPYYGDPASLAKMVGLSVALNYEQAIAAERTRIQEQARLERERQEQSLSKQKGIDNTTSIEYYWQRVLGIILLFLSLFLFAVLTIFSKVVLFSAINGGFLFLFGWAAYPLSLGLIVFAMAHLVEGMRNRKLLRWWLAWSFCG